MQDEPDVDIKPVFQPCICCGKRRVVHVGDTCVQCTLMKDNPQDNHRYVILSPATMELAISLSGIPGEFLKAKMDQAFERFQHYVIFEAREEWESLFIDEKFPVPFVMTHLFKRLED